MQPRGPEDSQRSQFASASLVQSLKYVPACQALFFSLLSVAQEKFKLHIQFTKVKRTRFKSQTLR